MALPILKETKAGDILVNFDESFFALLQESEKLMKLDIPLPSVNQALITKRIWFYDYKSIVEMMLANYHHALRQEVENELVDITSFLKDKAQALTKSWNFHATSLKLLLCQLNPSCTGAILSSCILCSGVLCNIIIMHFVFRSVVQYYHHAYCAQ